MSKFLPRIKAALMSLFSVEIIKNPPHWLSSKEGTFTIAISYISAICLATYIPEADACEREWVTPLPSPIT